LAGAQALAENGVEAVKVERLAARIGVSKAPFYWRFKDRQALLDAILDYWREDQTKSLIDRVAPLDTPRARLDALIALSLDTEIDGIDVAGIEGAIRAWAAQDESVAAFVAEVDALRIAYLVEQFTALGADATEARPLADGIYLALIGLYTVRRYTPALAGDAAFAAIVGAVLDGLERRR
jgi:AcrR family transcriptional regulator